MTPIKNQSTPYIANTLAHVHTQNKGLYRGEKRTKNEKDNCNLKCRDINPGTQKCKISKSDTN